MYEYLRGKAHPKGDEFLVLDVNGIGYKIATPASVIASFVGSQPSERESTIYVELIIREDAHTLYGFLHEADRELFRLLMTVNGVGPKLALQIMNHGTSQEIIKALSERDTRWLSSISGIGKKTAERLSIELSDKTALLYRSLPPIHSSHSNSVREKDAFTAHEAKNDSVSLREEAVQALIALGLSENEAHQSVKEALRHIAHPEEESVLKLIQLSLLHRKKGVHIKR